MCKLQERLTISFILGTELDGANFFSHLFIYLFIQVIVVVSFLISVCKMLLPPLILSTKCLYLFLLLP